MSIDFSKFDKQVDLEGLKKDIEDARVNESVDFKEVPHGQYEVKITRLELKESKKGNPMLSIWFKVLEGEHKGGLIFMNQVVTTGFQIHIANEFLRSLQSGIEIDWPGTYVAYAQLIMDVAEAIDNKFEYALKYGENKGFNTFKIEDVFILE